MPRYKWSAHRRASDVAEQRASWAGPVETALRACLPPCGFGGAHRRSRRPGGLHHPPVALRTRPLATLCALVSQRAKVYTWVVCCCDGEVGCVAKVVRAVADELPTATYGLPSSPGFGDGKRGGADEEVGADDEDPVIDEDAPCAPSAPPAHAYSTVKSRCAAADPLSTALSHA